MISLTFGGATDKGQVRNLNQDRFLIASPVFVVADGIGGHLGGEVAAQLAVDEINRFINEDNKDAPSSKSLINAAISANQVVWRRAQKDSSVHGMGTTITAMVLVREDDEERLAIVNIGDSRTYLLRDGELQQLTTDNSLVEELLRTGQLTPQEAEVHPRRNILTKALGVDASVEPDLIQVLPLRGDRFLLCSDGLVRELTDDQIASVLRRLSDPTEAAKELVSRAREHGGADNITVVVVDVVDDDGQVERAATAAKVEHSKSSSNADESGASNKPIVNQTTARINPKSDHLASIVQPKAAHKPILTLRVVLFLFALLAVIGLTGVLITSYATHSYYVGLDGKNVAIYRGRPGGVFWIHPKLVERTDLTLDAVPPSRAGDIKDNKLEPSLQAARTYITNIKQEAQSLGITTTTITTLAPAGGTP